MDCRWPTIKLLSYNTNFGQAFGLLIAAFCMPITIIKRLLGRWFLWLHRAIALGAVAVIFWHVLTIQSTLARIIVGSSCGFWLSMALFRIFRVLYFGHSGTVIQRSGNADALHVTIRLTHPIELQPGNYFYIYFPAFWLKYNILQSYTAMAFWHSPASPSGAVTELTFLLSRNGNHAKAISSLAEGQSILLDGPYGVDYSLQSYETIILAAKGLGIAATIPIALSFAARRQHDNKIRDKLQEMIERQNSITEQQSSATGDGLQILIQKKKDIAQERLTLIRTKLYWDTVKKIDLFWSLENNDQIILAEEQLQALQAFDPNNVCLIIPDRYIGFLIFL